MHMERLKHIKENLMCAVEAQMYNLEEVDAKELGEVVDMIKDIEEAIYYCTVTKAMEKPEEYGWREEKKHYGDMGPMYYSDRGNGNHASSSGHNMNGMGGNGGHHQSYYTENMNHQMVTEREFPHAFKDEREGKSYRSRRMYMEAKETHQDKTTQMKELEKYAQELTQDIIEMVQDASPEERQYLSKKITVLANKVTQLNDTH